jgi:hypothetical protein
MFAVAGESSSNEGGTDENPIQLQGDTADEFRALMLSLYALYVDGFDIVQTTYSSMVPFAINRPHEIRDAMQTPGHTERLCRCARIAHKYQFQSIESWALEILAKPLLWSLDPSLMMLAEVAVLCDHTGLLNLTKHALRISLRNKTNRSLIIDVAERLNFRDIKGLAYYAMMLTGREVWEADPLLTRDQRIRLLSGFYTLAHLGPATPPPPPLLPHWGLCQTGACKIAWEALWRKSLAGEIRLTNDEVELQALRRRTDLLGKMWYAEQVIEESSTKWTLDSGHHGMCGTSVNAMCGAIESVLEQVSETFADHFADVA